MQTEISTEEPSGTIKSWNDLDMGQKTQYTMRAQVDPVFFWNNEYMGGQKLWPFQKELMAKFYTLDDDGKRLFTELIIVAGMRSSKTYISGLISVYETFRLLSLPDPAAFYKLAPGSEIFVINVATSYEQAMDTVFARCKALIEYSPWFQAQDFRTTSDEFRFNEKHVVLKSIGSSSSSAVGRTVKTVVFDELAKFIDNTKRRSASKVYQTLTKSTDTFRPYNENVRVVISSPEYEGDFLMQLLEKAQNDPWPGVLPYHLRTWDMNPHLTYEILQAEEKKDPEGFKRDFGASPLREMDNFIPKELYKRILNESNRPNGFVQTYANEPPQVMIMADPNVGEYILAGDPALRMDGFGIAIGHLNNLKVIIDGTCRLRATKTEQLNPIEASDFLLSLCDTFPIGTALFDTWQFPETIQKIEDRGIPIIQNTVELKEYGRLRSLLFLNEVDLPKDEELFEELRGLVLIKNKRIDHPRVGGKDMADAVANIVWHLRGEDIDTGSKPGFNLARRF
tara:strand:- start:3105 stop:4631 length:1527 start_codon:yes stop_codon:yes gene_type:complete